MVLKLARGHAAHQYSEPHLDEPRRIMIAPLLTMAQEEREKFERIPDSPIYPEIGSRAYVAGEETLPIKNGWTVVQHGRYRFAIAQPAETLVRSVMSEYLACEVEW